MKNFMHEMIHYSTKYQNKLWNVHALQHHAVMKKQWGIPLYTTVISEKNLYSEKNHSSEKYTSILLFI